MLLQFECANHKSIKERVNFSMLATSDRSAEEYMGQFDKFKVLRSAAIYGANGSGKSNFLDALGYMRSLVGTSILLQPGQGPLQLPHKLSAPTTPSDYDIQFVKGGIRFAYGFSVANDRIDSEYMYHYPRGRKARIFERDKMNVNVGPKFRNEFGTSLGVLKPNRLFLSCAANYSNVAPVEEGFKFFTQDLVVYNSAFSEGWMNYSMRQLSQNTKLKESFLSLMKALGIFIKDVKVSFEPVNIGDLQQMFPIPEFLQELIGSQSGNRIEARVVYDEFETDLWNEESDGIRRLFQILCPLIDIVATGKVLLWDELEANLHEVLVKQILEFFKTSYVEESAQLIFTTHDSSLLDTGIFRRDQIWFTEQNQHRSTDLYSLSEIRDVRKKENLERGYLNGKYGAIPVLDEKVLQELQHSGGK